MLLFYRYPLPGPASPLGQNKARSSSVHLAARS
jgi:hypothetical protein